jgi:hypothetical protein
MKVAMLDNGGEKGRQVNRNKEKDVCVRYKSEVELQYDHVLAHLITRHA